MTLGEKIETGATIALVVAGAYVFYKVRKEGFIGAFDDFFGGEKSLTEQTGTGGGVSPQIADVTTTTLPGQIKLPGTDFTMFEAIPGQTLAVSLWDSFMSLFNGGSTPTTTTKSLTTTTDWSQYMSSNPEAVAKQLGTISPIETSSSSKAIKQTSEAINQTIQAVSEANKSGSDRVQLTPTISASKAAVDSGKVVLVKATGSEQTGSFSANADAYIANKAKSLGINTKGLTSSQVVTALNKANSAAKK